MTDKPTIDRVLVEVTVPAPADTVWTALRDPQHIKQWFGWDADTLKDEIDFIFLTHAVADDAARTVRFTGTPDRYEVEARGEQSLVRVIRAAPADETWSETFDPMIEGWIAFTEQLAFALGRHPGETRRTVFLAGAPKDGHDALARETLGLTALGAPGEPWAQALGPEAKASGTVWHLGRHQTGITVAGFGDGLLIAADCPADEKRPKGEVSLTLTTYGLSDPDFTALEARWKGWWDGRFTRAAAPGCD